MFHFSRSTGSIKVFSVKNLEQYKKLPSNKFVKKDIFWKTFCSMQNFLKLQFLVDDLVDFLNYQCLSMPLYLSILFEARDRELEHKRKTHFVRYH